MAEEQYWSRKSLVPWLFFLTQTVGLVLGLGPRVKGIPAVIVFGDSTVDSGNNNFIPTMARSNFRPYGRDFLGGRPTGRFCNGRLPSDFLSEALGLGPAVPAYLDPSYKISDFVSGVCFASAGTGFDNATSDLLGVIPLWKEVQYYKEYQAKLRAYLGNDKANTVINKAVYLVSIGTNDFLENYFVLPKTQEQFTQSQYQDFLVGLAKSFVEEIYGLGARRIALTGLPPMGCVPLERLASSACAEDKNAVASEYNEKLEKLLEKTSKKLPGIKLVYADTYGILLDIITRPSVYGFEESAIGCCGFLCHPKSPFTCPDASKYVFWDAMHPSERTNQLITDHLIEANLAKIL